MPSKKIKKSPASKKKTLPKTPKIKKISPRKTSRKKKSNAEIHEQPLVFAFQTEKIQEQPMVSHFALSGHRPRFEHTWIVVGCFSLLFASFLFLSSQIRAAQDTGGNGLQAAAVTATVLPNQYNTKQLNFFEKWLASLDPITKLSYESGAILFLLIVISLVLLRKKNPQKINSIPNQISHGLPA